MTLRGLAAILISAGILPGQSSLSERVHTLRSVPDEQRGSVTKDLALQIRTLPEGAERALLAQQLANLSTEGDFGADALQEVATTLGEALRGDTAQEDWRSLAQLVRYEHVRPPFASPLLDSAIVQLAADDARREQGNFALKDLHGKTWTLKDLRGKVVLVNFWATWCPPCRKEMPDLNTLYREFGKKGLVVLAISDEEEAVIRPFIAKQGYGFPVLRDPGAVVTRRFVVQGIPKTFIFNREGKLASQSIDMRTRGQFLKMLADAGLR